MAGIESDRSNGEPEAMEPRKSQGGGEWQSPVEGQAKFDGNHSCLERDESHEFYLGEGGSHFNKGAEIVLETRRVVKVEDMSADDRNKVENEEAKFERDDFKEIERRVSQNGISREQARLEVKKGKWRADCLVFLIDDLFQSEGCLQNGSQGGQFEVRVTSRFDDIVNGADLFFGILSENNVPTAGALEVAVDATSQDKNNVPTVAPKVAVDATSQITLVAIRKKMLHGKGQKGITPLYEMLTQVKYYESGGFKGERSDLPHCVLGMGGDFVDKLIYGHLCDKNGVKYKVVDAGELEILKKRFYRLLFLQLYLQEKIISIFAEKELEHNKDSNIIKRLQSIATETQNSDEIKRIERLQSIATETQNSANFFFGAIESRLKEEGGNLAKYISAENFTPKEAVGHFDAVFDKSTLGVICTCLGMLFSNMSKDEIKKYLGRDGFGADVKSYIDYLKAGAVNMGSVAYNNEVVKLEKRYEEAFTLPKGQQQQGKNNEEFTLPDEQQQQQQGKIKDAFTPPKGQQQGKNNEEFTLPGGRRMVIISQTKKRG